MVMAAPTASNKVLLPLAEIRLDGGTQSRALLDDATIERYAENYGAEMAMPAVVVFYDGTSYWLADGFHRCAGATKAGRDAIIAEIFQGSVRDAILFSVGANEKHGLPRSNADKRRAVEMLLRDEEWSQKSDRWIAEKCCVDHKTVAVRRPEFPTGEVPQLAERTGQDGKVRKLPTRKAKAEPVSSALDAEPPRAPSAFGPPDPAKWWVCRKCESEFNLESATAQGWVARGLCDSCEAERADAPQVDEWDPADVVPGLAIVEPAETAAPSAGWPSQEDRLRNIARLMESARPHAEALHHKLTGIIANARKAGLGQIGGIGGFRLGVELTAVGDAINELRSMFS